MITEDQLRQNILDMRRQIGHVACAVFVGSEAWFLMGQMMAGIPVAEYPLQCPPDAYLLLGIPVDEPGLACAELGME